MRIRLLAVDLDGTLLNGSWSISDGNRQALIRAHAQGVEIACVTGRRFSFTQPLTAALGFRHYLITNAGALTCSNDGGRLFSQPIDNALAADFLRFARVFRPWTFLIFDGQGRGEVVCASPNRDNPHISRYLDSNRDYLEEMTNIEEIKRNNLLQIVFMGDIPDMERAERFIQTYPGKTNFKLLRTEYPLRNLALLDVIDRSIDKGKALAKLAGSLGIAQADVMAIGDNHNDLEMLQYAGLPVVMENAAQELKEFGWTVTGHHDADGVAAAIEKFILA